MVLTKAAAMASRRSGRPRTVAVGGPLKGCMVRRAVVTAGSLATPMAQPTALRMARLAWWRRGCGVCSQRWVATKRPRVVAGGSVIRGALAVGAWWGPRAALRWAGRVLVGPRGWSDQVRP